MRDLTVILFHLIATVARLLSRGGARSVVAESVLLRHQLLILNRRRERAPNLRPIDRLIAGLCAARIHLFGSLNVPSFSNPQRSWVSTEPS